VKAVYVPAILAVFRRHEGQKSRQIAVGRRKTAIQLEREQLQRRMFALEGTPLVKQVAGRALFWFLVRWHVHVWRRFYRTVIPAGTPVEAVKAQWIGPWPASSAGK
jgi:hypothetical protein